MTSGWLRRGWLPPVGRRSMLFSDGVVLRIVLFAVMFLIAGMASLAMLTAAYALFGVAMLVLAVGCWRWAVHEVALWPSAATTEDGHPERE